MAKKNESESKREQPERKPKLNEILERCSTKWNVNESILQSYRSIFISSQAFLLAVGALLIDNKSIFFIVAFLSLYMVWGIWHPVVRSRHLIVDYWKYSYELASKQPEVLSKLCTEPEYVHDKHKRKEANKLLKIKTNWRPTRKKIDVLLPVFYTLIWIVLIPSLGSKLISAISSVSKSLEFWHCELFSW